MLDLQPIKDRLAAATPGPWTASQNVQPHGVAAVAEVNTVLVLSSGPLYGSPAQDANLIANAPTDLAALVAEVERLRSELDDAEARIERLLGALEAHQYYVAEVERLRAAIEAHRAQCHRTYKVAQAWWDEDLWAVLDE